MRKFEYVEESRRGFKLPTRATKNSMAYDIYSPEGFEVKAGETYMLKTGIKAKMGEDEGLILNIRSSMGKKNIMLKNVSGWIDSDFYPNEIGLMFYNYGEEDWKVEKNERVGQGMFIKYLTTEDDNATESRKGGWGSSGK